MLEGGGYQGPAGLRKLPEDRGSVFLRTGWTCQAPRDRSQEYHPMPCFVYLSGLSTHFPISALNLENNPMRLASLYPRDHCKSATVGGSASRGHWGRFTVGVTWRIARGRRETVQGWPGLPGLLFSHLVLLPSAATCQIPHLLC